MERTNILLVEDDYALALGTTYALKAEGYEVFHATNIRQAYELLDNSIDLVLLDVMLPDGNGYDFCRDIREKGNYVPVIFLTAVADEVNLVQGLLLGADDYISKPYRVKELLTRILVILRRQKYNSERLENSSPSYNGATNIYSFGETSVDFDSFKIIRAGYSIDVTPSELRLIKELIIHKGQTLTRKQLIERLWDVDEAFVDDNTLSVYIKRLRDKLGGDADYIQTVRGVGYRFSEQER